MNEQRTQAYLTLINQLLSCNEGDESRILQENQELLDQGLAETMIAVAQQLGEAGRENEAQWLRNMAQQLAEALGRSTKETSNTPQDYLNFLMEVLQKVSENPNSQVTYPFLAQNLDKLDDNLIKILKKWATDTLSSSTNAVDDFIIAKAICNFSNLILEFPLNNIAINKEIAIAGHEIALTVFTFDIFPQEWAMIQQNLATAYSDRIRGDKAENLEKAITFCQKALKVYTVEAFPTNWASTQYNLAYIYSDRIREDKADNLELVIKAYTKALMVYTFEEFPVDWARTQNNLAVAYIDRIRGNKSDNLEQAIIANTNALKVRTLEAFPYEWAATQNNLARAYRDRIRGNKADNVEFAIRACTEALKVYTLEEFPVGWAKTQIHLGNTYIKRIRGNKADNLEQAIVAHTKALKVYTLEEFPVGWAQTHNNLANAYRDRIRGNKADNLEQAIVSYTEALKVYTLEKFPYEWATTQSNLSIAYIKRIRGNKADNLELAIATFKRVLKIYNFEKFPYEWAETQNNLAIALLYTSREDKEENLEQVISCYKKALKVFTLEAFPIDWAMTQNNLAYVYSERIRGDKAENLEKAINYYHNALTIYTKENAPLNCLQTARNLANLHYEHQQWQPATKAYHTAIEAVENARLEALNPQSRQEVLSNAIDVFHRIVQAYINLNQPEKALEYVERSKGRNLVELMTQKGLKPKNVSQETIDKLAELKQQVVNEQIRLQHQSINQNLIQNDNLTPYVQDHSYLKEYQQELDTLIAENITPNDLTFSLTQKVQPIPFKEIKSLTDDSTCLLQWYITKRKILAFIVSGNEMVKVLQFSEEDIKQLADTIDYYRQLYYSETGKKEWINQLPNLLQIFANTLHINEIISIIPEACQRLIIIPHWVLHTLPLHALPIDDNYILQDKYDIQYAPSCQLLQISKQRPLNQLSNLFAIQNPTKDLIFTDLEVNIISTLFNKKEIIAKEKATKSTVTTQIKASESHCYHFSCHGSFNRNNPLESALLLAKPDTLKLGEIFDIDLKKSRLMVLSACETGLIDLNSISDEYIGLPAGFLFAGSSSVVSSLWTVSDLSTSFLMMKLYEIVLDKTQDISVPVALKMAQNWLKNLTVEEYRTTLNNCNDIVKQNQQRLTVKELSRLMDMIEDEQYRIKRFEPNYKLFNDPFYWAAFTASGI